MNRSRLYTDLYFVWHNKALWITSTISSLFFTTLFLLNAEPLYIAQAKLLVQERGKDSISLRYWRSGLKEDTLAGLHTEILLSDQVLISALRGIKEPSSKSFLMRLLQRLGVAWERQEVSVKEFGLQELKERVKEMHKDLKVSIVNPEVIDVTVRSNSPEQSILLLEAILRAHRRQYRDFLLSEVKQHQAFYKEKIVEERKKLENRAQAIVAFEQLYSLKASAEKGYFYLPSLTTKLEQQLPFKQLFASLGHLEASYIAAESRTQPEGYLSRLLREQINEMRQLLKSLGNPLIEMGKIKQLYGQLVWQKKLKQEQLFEFINQYDQQLLAKGQISELTDSIILLDPPHVDSEPIYPKWTQSLFLAFCLGSLLGAVLLYLWSFIDKTVFDTAQIKNSLRTALLAVVQEL